MNITVRKIGGGAEVMVDWPDGWPVPRVGDDVHLPGSPAAWTVHRVVWYPEGDPENDSPEPAVSVVLWRAV